MKGNLTVLLVLLFGCQYTYAQKKSKVTTQKIVIEGQVPPGYNKDSIELITLPVDEITYVSGEVQTFWQKIVKGTVKWILPATKPLYVMGSFVGRPSTIPFQVELGDSISIAYNEKKITFSGRGASKFQLIYKLGMIEDSLKKSTFFRSLSTEHDPLTSLGDYFAWNVYLNQRATLMLKVIDSYRSNISDFAYNIIKEKALYKIEEQRVGKFRHLIGKAQSKEEKLKAQVDVNQFGLTNQDLCAIYDSTLNGPAAKWLQYEAPVVGDPYYLWQITTLDAYRQKGQFFKKNPSDTGILGKDKADVYIASYNLAKKKYRELIREEVLAFFFHYPRGVIHDIGFDPKVEALLADYYARPGYPEYKRAVRKYELEQREKQAGKRDLDFTLTDTQGRLFTKKQLKGKVAVLDFWFTGCTGCMQMVPALRKVEEFFKSDTNIVFLSISIDKDKDQWMRSIAQKKYTTGNGINLYTDGEGINHRMIRNFGIDGYPTLLLLDAYGKTIRQSIKLDPRTDDGRGLIELIQKQLVLTKDGPYILHKGDWTTVYSISGGLLVDTQLEKTAMLSFQVQTDKLGKSFTVSLKKSLSIEPCEFKNPGKLFALSDIEGNFEALRKLLQANKIIDENYNWIFGNGHLVFAGDMFDRGSQVTECLWLIYDLEEKAKAKGGYVHFILGNHEIMNLQGDDRYAQYKYKENADLIGTTITQLYNENSELGRWLRTKNVVEKIGDILFMHAGISPRLNELSVTISEINQLARPYYGEKVTEYKNEKLNTIMSASVGPFWYRGYYSGNVEKYIESTLEKFAVNRIITGHTIVADTVSIHYGGKVINLDTQHSEGKSEALLMENASYYRVNTAGEKVELYLNLRKDPNYIAEEQ
jgi:cytochrome oxidase Cu insertion factor (SCO1/SenC/PrrC family)